MDKADLIDRLDVLALRLWRLAPSHRDPEAFHAEKSDLVDELRRLIADVQGGKSAGSREAREANAGSRFLPPCESPKENMSLRGKGG